jgi:hypothetical protein
VRRHSLELDPHSAPAEYDLAVRAPGCESRFGGVVGDVLDESALKVDPPQFPGREEAHTTAVGRPEGSVSLLRAGELLRHRARERAQPDAAALVVLRREHELTSVGRESEAPLNEKFRVRWT